MISRSDQTMSVREQCQLLAIPRSRLYYRERPKIPGNIELMNMIDEYFTAHPCTGVAGMVAYLRDGGKKCGPKRIRRLMRQMRLMASYPQPRVSLPDKEHKIYPYLLRGVEIKRPNQVWSTDITYIRLGHGFAYLVAVVDWYSRSVLSWRLSNTMDVSFCCDALDEALRLYGCPEIFNSDQGSQFTSGEFIKRLTDNNILVSMDGCGRALDNIFIERLWRTVKYEDVYLKGYETMAEASAGLAKYFDWYNHGRLHMSLGYRRPWDVYTNELRKPHEQHTEK